MRIADIEYPGDAIRQPIMTAIRYCCASLVIYGSLVGTSNSQWSPHGGLLDVPVTNDCSITGGEIALARPDGIFLCPSRARAIDEQIADASHFYLVHAYGSLAIHKASKKLADCWAAHQLADTPNGPYYVKQWIRHWRTYGVSSSTYGTPEQRIANVRSCCACGV